MEKGTIYDLDELENLYNDLNDHLETNINYPGWIKGVYPTRETALKGVEESNLFVFRIDNTIAGSIILNHHPEEAYKQVEWGVDAKAENIIVIHTLVVHPSFMNKGIATKLINFATKYSKEQEMKAIRLDVSVNNMAAIKLYEKLGYKYIGTVDLGLPYAHLKWFKLYEMILNND